MSFSLRAALGVAAFGLAITVGCSSSDSSGPDTDSGADAGPPCSRLTTLCPSGEPCEGAQDCQSSLCRTGTCQDVDPPNGVKDNDETDVDCGGSHAPACADGKACVIADDCTSEVCTGGICQVPTPTDGVKNGDETGTDCGGTKAPGCAPGQGCRADSDCNKSKCDLTNKVCLAPTHDDGIQNLDETGIDCGGPTASVKRCPPGQGCGGDSDCDNTRCDTTGAKTCNQPTSSDGLKNGTESDVDCGGAAPTNAPKCLITKGCTANSDCMSNGCSMNTGKCEVLSCASSATAGIVSCGSGETGEATAKHESCCKSLVLPTRTTRRLDKYEITSGRYRTFLNAIGPNVQQWVKTYIAANPTSQLASMITTGVAPDGSDLTSIFPSADTTGAHSLTAHLETDIDNYSGIRGCVNDYTATPGAGNYSANTYWVDKAHMTAVNIAERIIPQAQSDEKSLNCAMPMMFAAFCAWDGGEMATMADYQDVWPVAAATKYPWGATDILRSDSSGDGTYHYNYCNGNYKNGGFVCQCLPAAQAGQDQQASCPAGGFNNIDGGGIFYEYPRGTDKSRDNEPLIGAPGRFQGDATMLQSNGESWMDIYANLAEYTGDFKPGTASGTGTSNWCDFSVANGNSATACTRSDHADPGTVYNNVPNTRIEGVTWEGHIYNNNSTTTFPATFQYGKFGARCVRPADPF